MNTPKEHPYYIKVASALDVNGLRSEKEDLLIQDILNNLFLKPTDIHEYERKKLMEN